MAKDYAALADAVKGQVNTIAVNCDKYSDLCQAHNVTGYPTLRSYVNGTVSSFPSGPRTKQAMLSWLQTLGIYAPLPRLQASELAQELAKNRVLFLYLGAPSASEQEKEVVGAAAIAYGQAPVFYATGPELLQRFPALATAAGYASIGSRLLVFKESASEPAAALELSSVTEQGVDAGRDHVLHWLQTEGHERVTEMDASNVQELLYTQKHPLVLAVLGSTAAQPAPVSAQLDQARQLASAWAKDDPQGTVRFAWVDGERSAALVERHLHTGSRPLLVYLRPIDHTMANYTAPDALVNQKATLAWIRTAHAGSIARVSYGSTLDRALGSIRTSGATAQTVVVRHPWWILFVGVLLLLLSPPVRRRLFPATQGYRKLV